MTSSSKYKFWLAFFSVVVLCSAAFGVFISWIAPTKTSLFIVVATLIAISLFIDLLGRFSRARSLNWTSCHDLRVEESTEYIGIYHPHWEIGNIEVMVGRRLWLVPKFERWSPKSACQPFDDILPESNYPIRIQFVGCVSERGTFGHMGYMQREVVVEKILDATPLGNA